MVEVGGGASKIIPGSSWRSDSALRHFYFRLTFPLKSVSLITTSVNFTVDGLSTSKLLCFKMHK